jgi:hypothetical protein
MVSWNGGPTIRGLVAATAAERADPSEAWAAVLIANAEKTMIIDPNGKRISKQELRVRAMKEAN